MSHLHGSSGRAINLTVTLARVLAMSPRTQRHKRLALSYCRAMSAPDLPGPFRFVSRNFRLSGGNLTGDLNLAEAIAWRQGILRAFPDLKVELGPAITLSEKDTVAIRLRWTGTHCGTFHEIPPTFIKVDVALFAFFRFRNGFIDRVTQLTDAHALLEQLRAAASVPARAKPLLPTLGADTMSGMEEPSHPLFVPPESFNGLG